MIDRSKYKSANEAHEAQIAEWLKTLTKREQEVLRLLAHGKSAQDIADKLGGVGVETVRTHIRRLIMKMHVCDSRSLIAIAICYFDCKPTAEEIYESSGYLW